MINHHRIFFFWKKKKKVNNIFVLSGPLKTFLSFFLFSGENIEGSLPLSLVFFFIFFAPTTVLTPA